LKVEKLLFNFKCFRLVEIELAEINTVEHYQKVSRGNENILPQKLEYLKIE